MITEEPIKIQEPKKKFLIPVIIIIGVLIIGGGIFAYFQFFKEDSVTDIKNVETIQIKPGYILYTHPVDGFKIQYPEGSTINQYPVSGQTCGQNTCAVSIELNNGDYVSIAVTPSWWFVSKKQYSEAVNDPEFKEVFFGNTKVIASEFRENIEEKTLSVGEAFTKYKDKIYYITYGLTDKVNELLDTFTVGDALAEKVAFVGPWGGIDTKAKGDLKMLSLALQLSQKDENLPISDSIVLKIDREEGVPSQLKNVIDIKPSIPTPSQGAPRSFYGYQTHGPNTFELTAALENNFDPECVIENDLCIFRMVNGEITSKK
jgi:hypothetical protein